MSPINSASSSPSHYALAGNFSPEDIQELLGAMAGEHQHNLNQHDGGDDDEPAIGDHAEDTADDGHDDVKGGHGEDPIFPLEATTSSSNTGDKAGDLKEIPEDSKAQARSERKRSREKQRRSDVNKQFNDLTQVLRQIEVEEAEEESSKPRLAFSASNRVDLIARTIIHLERLSKLSKKRKSEIESLQQQLDLAKKAGEDTAQKLKEAMFSQPVGKQQVRVLHLSR
jgi:hypothetical protein